MFDPSGQQTVIHYLVMAKVRERLTVNKQRWHIFLMKRCSPKMLNGIEGTE
jgi:hypothetical protein